MGGQTDAVADLLDILREAGAGGSRSPRWPSGCREQACSSCSANKRVTGIGSGLAGRLTAAQPSHGAGKIWTDVSPQSGVLRM